MGECIEKLEAAPAGPMTTCAHFASDSDCSGAKYCKWDAGECVLGVAELIHLHLIDRNARTIQGALAYIAKVFEVAHVNYLPVVRLTAYDRANVTDFAGMQDATTALSLVRGAINDLMTPQDGSWYSHEGDEGSMKPKNCTFFEQGLTTPATSVLVNGTAVLTIIGDMVA